MQHQAWIPPEILDLGNEADRARFEMLSYANYEAVVQHDTIDSQLRDYVGMMHPRERLSNGRIASEIAKLLGTVDLFDFGRWVYYPWSNRLVHVLPPELFADVRANRNLYKITLEERRRLRRFNVGVVGLSVGSAVARTLCLEGIGGVTRLADFDVLELSNLNRLPIGIHEIGTSKAVVCARQLLEIDPYAQVDVFPSGLTHVNLEQFLMGPPQLDVVIDECDSLDMKLLLREKARQNRIPVLMHTSDRGMLDVERFDLEPGRPILHGRVGDLRAAELQGLTTEQKVEYVLRILSPRELSARAAASMLEIERSISTWPQLASDVQAGGAVVATAVRHLCLGAPLESGRRFIDIDRLILAVDEAAPPAALSCHASLRRRLKREPSLPCRLIDYAVLAPSAGNCQPWRFALDGNELLVLRDVDAKQGIRDVEGFASFLAIGAAIENAMLAAPELGVDAHLSLFPETGHDNLVASISCSGMSPSKGKRWLEVIEHRCTNRRIGDGSRLSRKENAGLCESGATDITHLQLTADDHDRDAVGHTLAAFDRLQFTVPSIHAETMAEMRWDPTESLRTGDGIDLDTLDIDQKERLGLQLVARPDVAAFLRSQNRGSALEEWATRALASSSAAGLLRVKAQTPSGFVEAGRAMQRIWLTATSLGLSVQPWTGLTFVSKLPAVRQIEIFTEGEIAHLENLRTQLDEVFCEHADWPSALLFRVFRADPPSARSRRRPLEEVLQSSNGLSRRRH